MGEASVPLDPRQVRDYVADILLAKDMGHTRLDFFGCCRDFHRATERPVAGQNPYFDRLLQSVHAWMAMSGADRQILIAGREDGVAWRGEPIARYLDIVNETEIYRRTPKDAYLARLKAKIATLGANTRTGN